MLLKLAWRDLRLSRARCAFIVAAMAAGMASMGGVRSAAGIARKALHRESRAWLGGDLSVTTGNSIDGEELEALGRMRQSGIEWTLVATAATMASSDESPDASLLVVKAVDPAVYPLYGAVAVKPSQTLAAALGPDRAVVSEDVLSRFHVGPGGTLRIGAQRFRISAVIQSEPDRFGGMTVLGTRCILSHEGYERSGIARSGNSNRLRLLFRLPPNTDWMAVRAQLQEWFPEAGVSDYHEANRDAVSAMETAASFLSVATLLAFILGAMGVGVAVREHAEQRIQTLAVMKMLGARSPQLTALFAAQVGYLMAAACIAGFPLAWGIRAAVLSVAAHYVSLPPAGWDFTAMLETVTAGAVAAGVVLVQPAMLVRRVKPARILRRDFEPAPPGETGSVLGLAVACAALGTLALRLLGSWTLALFLVLALAGGVVAAFALAHGLLAALRRWLIPRVLSGAPRMRQGLANLYRPGNRAASLIVSLAVGMMMLLATLQIHGAVAQSILEALPFDRPSLVVSGLEDPASRGVRAFLERQDGVEKVEMLAQARVRVFVLDRALAGAPVGSGGHAELPACRFDSPAAPGTVTMSTSAARRFGVDAGSRVELVARGATIRATVAGIRPMTRVEEFFGSFTMDCSGLDPASLFYHAAARIQPDRIAAVRAALLAEYPTLPVFSADDLREVVGDASREAAWLIRIVAWFALGSGVAVLIAIMAASRGPRLREIGILSALGARRGTLVKLYTTEFAAIGLLSGLIAGVLAQGFTVAALAAIFHRAATIEWNSLAAAMAARMAASIVAGVLVSVSAGWLPTFGLLKRRPLEALRCD